MENESEVRLIARAREDPEAFGELYQRYVARVYRYLYYRTGNPEDAEDLTAWTFHQALKHLSRYVDYGAPFEAWLYRIAHNAVANWLRQRSRRPVVALDAVQTAEPERNGPQAVVESAEERQRLLRAVRRLPPDRQELLILKFVEGLSNREIGIILERSEGAVKSLYHRTLVALRDELTDEAWLREAMGADQEEENG
jgi:RNA polymerase sigma-70 factor (ECF subfamily)